MSAYRRNWEHYGVAEKLPVEKDPLKHGTKAEKLAYCQRQIDRFNRWLERDPGCPEFIAARDQWTKMKQFALEGRI